MNKKTIFIIIAGAIILILIITIPTVLLVNKEFCHLNLKEDLTEEHPLILQLNNNKFILPNDDNGISLSQGETIRLVCAGKTNNFNISDLNVKEIHATCVSNKIFTTNIVNIGEINFKKLLCLQVPESIAKRTGETCYSDKTDIQIGFETYGGFVQLFKTCFDPVQKNSLYSKFTLSRKVSITQQQTRTNVFQDSDFYKDVIASVDSLYKNQTEFFKTIIGAKNVAKYFDKSVNYYSRGHLTANADFQYHSQRHATFFYVNVAPQWKDFNAGNWNILEQNIRNYASKQFNDLIVYTGVYGQVKLPDETNTLEDLYLYSKDMNTYLTVPEIFWKLVYNPYYHTATVFVGQNNIFETKIKTLCTDICDKISWLTWDPKNVTAGISYCCDYYEFRNVVNLLPDLLIFGYLA